MAHDKFKVLVIEDEAPIRKFLRASLVESGYRVVETESGAAGLASAMSEPPDVVLLDLGLPDMDGLDVAKVLRQWSKVPIIVLSARGQEMDKVAALDAGSDDYLTKPFGPAELMARIRAVIRRYPADTTHNAVFTTGELRVDMAARRVTVAGQDVRLTAMQYRLLTTMIRDAGKVLTHAHLLREVWGPADPPDAHALRVVMASLRKKLEPDPDCPRYLLTEQGVGYRLTMD